MDTISRREPLAHAGIGRKARAKPPKRHGVASALRRWGLRLGLPALFGGPAALLAAPPPSQPALLPWYEAHTHLEGELPFVIQPWRDVVKHGHGNGWRLRVTVNEEGRVTKAVPVFGDAAHRAQAVSLARALVFKPFEENGQAVAKDVDLTLEGRVQDYVGPADRNFPASLDAKQVQLTLERTPCLGACPSYTVELQGNGQVTYRGRDHVVVKGVHRWRVPPAAVAALVARFQQADYFKLQGYYVADVTDLPTYTTVLRIGGQQKFVLNYGGGNTVPDGVMASYSSGAPGPRMPPVVTELEDAIDATAGTRSWVKGDDKTLSVLRRAGWGPRSQAAGRVLAELTARCASNAAADFVRAGAPVIAVKEPGAPVVSAAHCGDVGLVRLLAEHGGLQRREDAQGLLVAAARHGYAELVALALAKGAKGLTPNGADPDDMPLFLAARAVQRDDPRPPTLQAAQFNPARVVEFLLAAGADPRARDQEGNTPLFEAWDASAVEALVRGGADVHATNQDGETALFKQMDGDVVQVLVKAGANVQARDPDGRTALFHQRWPQVIEPLVRAGADVNAKDKEGRTALETALDQEVAMALLAAGAEWPSDPMRWDALAAKAQDRQWTQLLPLLTAARRGASTP